jgi:hypothetical protein
MWSFVQVKGKNAPAVKKGRFGYGEIWTWVAIDADTGVAHVSARR